jgi:hypothetical protein
MSNIVLVGAPFADTHSAVFKHLHDFVDEIVVHGDECFEGLFEQIGSVPFACSWETARSGSPVQDRPPSWHAASENPAG